MTATTYYMPSRSKFSPPELLSLGIGANTLSLDIANSQGHISCIDCSVSIREDGLFYSLVYGSCGCYPRMSVEGYPCVVHVFISSGFLSMYHALVSYRSQLMAIVLIFEECTYSLQLQISGYYIDSPSFRKVEP